VSYRAADLDALDRVAANRGVLEVLATRSSLSTPGTASRWDIDGFVLHSHSDLSERLEEVAAGLGGGRRYRGVRGHAALIDDDGVIRAVVLGNAGLALRIADGATRAEIAAVCRFHWDGFGPEWVGAHAWPRELSREAGTSALARWLTIAFETPIRTQAGAADA
jgi:hypothetical protein